MLSKLKQVVVNFARKWVLTEDAVEQAISRAADENPGLYNANKEFFDLLKDNAYFIESTMNWVIIPSKTGWRKIYLCTRDKRHPNDYVCLGITAYSVVTRRGDIFAKPVEVEIDRWVGAPPEPSEVLEKLTEDELKEKLRKLEEYLYF